MQVFKQIINDLTLDTVKTCVGAVLVEEVESPVNLSHSTSDNTCTPIDEALVFNNNASQSVVVNGNPIGSTTIPSELVKVS